MKNSRLFMSLWVGALLFIIALLIVVLADWDWSIRIGVVILCAALAVLFILYAQRVERRPGVQWDLPTIEHEEQMLAAVNVMVEDRLKEISSVMEERDTGLRVFGEVDARMRQARDFSVASAIAKAPDLVLSEADLMGVTLNRAWKISRMKMGASFKWTPNTAARCTLHNVSGFGDAKPDVDHIALPEEIAKILKEGALIDGEKAAALPTLSGRAVSRVGVPVSMGEFQWGWLLLEDAEAKTLTETERMYLAALGRESAAALEAKDTWDSSRFNLESIYIQLSSQLDARRGAKAGREIRVASLLKEAAQHLAIPAVEVEAGYASAFLMDLGEIAVPELVLNKVEELTPQEKSFFERHPGMSVKLMRRFTLLQLIEEIVAAHHERWDGNGYPNRLAKDAIPRMARLLAVCDSYEAMVSNRSHRPAMDSSKALKIIHEQAGAQFDPEMVRAVASAAENWLLRNRIN